MPGNGQTFAGKAITGQKANGMESTTTDSRGEGATRRDVALGLLETHRRRTVVLGQRAFLQLLLSRSEACGSVDEIHDSLSLPSGINPAVLGAIPGRLRRASLIEAAGFAVASRPVAHARPVRLWRLINRAAAVRWLQENPDPSKPPLPMDGPQFLLPLPEAPL